MLGVGERDEERELVCAAATSAPVRCSQPLSLTHELSLTSFLPLELATPPLVFGASVSGSASVLGVSRGVPFSLGRGRI